MVDTFTMVRQIGGLHMEFQAERLEREGCYALSARCNDELYDTCKSDDVLADIGKYLLEIPGEVEPELLAGEEEIHLQA